MARKEFHDAYVAIRWGLLYNLYADRLLGFNMFPESVYDIRRCYFLSLHTNIFTPDSTCSMTETKWYANNIDQFGIRLDSR